MNTVDKVFEELRSLPEFALREVLDFVGFLKTKRGVPAGRPANDADGMDNAQVPWGEFEKLARESITESTKAPDLALMNGVRGKVRAGVTWTRDELPVENPGQFVQSSTCSSAT